MTALTINDQLLAELAKRADIRVVELVDRLMAGHATPEQYKSLTGEIRGIKATVDIAEAALHDIKNR